MSFNSNSIEVKRLFPAHSDEDRNVLDASKGYAKSNPDPEKKEKPFVDISAPVKLSDESMNIQNSSLTDVTILKSDIRAFSYEQIRVEGLGTPELPSPILKKQAISFQFSLSVATNAIVKLFLDLAAAREFHTILYEKMEIIIGKYDDNHLGSFCKGIFKCMIPFRNLTSIKIRLRIDTTFCKREIDLIGIKGNLSKNCYRLKVFKERGLFLKYFRRPDFKEMREPIKKLARKLSSHEFIEAEMLDTNKTINSFYDEHYDLSDQKDNFWLNSLMQGSFESSSYYYFHKILAIPNYIIGKKTMGFLENFIACYKQPMKDSCDPLPKATYLICEFLNEIIDSLFSDYNYGKKETKELMPYCRKSIEKYIFDRLYTTVSALYQHKFAKDDMKIKENINKILQLPFSEFLKKLHISSQYFEEESLEYSKTLQNFPSDKYTAALFEFDKISNFRTPYEKLSTILLVHILLKSKYSESPLLKKSQGEIKDNKVSLFVFLIIKGKVRNLRSEVALIEDYMAFFAKCEHEKKIVKYLKEALDIIFSYNN